MTSSWTTRRDGPILVATYDNPPMNYFTGRAFDDLLAVLAEAADSEVRALVLQGSPGGRFITHYSVEEILEGVRRTSEAIEASPQRNLKANSVGRAIAELPKPVIAAINGDAMGWGCELSLACDLRVMEDGDFRIGLVETSLGIIPGAGGTQRLARIVGRAAALELVLYGTAMTPVQALARGVVTELATDASARAVEIGKALARKAPLAIAGAKRAILVGEDLPIDVAVAIETDASFRAKISSGALEPLETYAALPYEQRRAYLEGLVP